MTDTRISAVFEIRRFSCTPAAVTAQIGVQPHDTWCVGDQIGVTAARRKYSGWRLSSPLSERHEVEPHVIWLLDQLPSSLALDEGCGSWEAQVSVVVRLQDRAPGVFFAPGTLERLAGLGVNLDIDIYVEGTLRVSS